MNLRPTEHERSFREEVRSFIQANLPPEIRERARAGLPALREHIVRWHRILQQRGWATPHWSIEHGGAGLSPMERVILSDEIARAPAPPPLMFNSGMIGPVLARFGSEEQKREFLPRIANLDIWFCQGFSEPNAGSDLASLRTQATLEGDHYRVQGQKIWTTQAHWADWIFCLVRTDPLARKQSGISMLLIDMRSPGVTVRPIVSIDGHHHLNEVFLDDVLVPRKNLVGEENKGWDYAKALLDHERIGIAGVSRSRERLQYARELAAQRPMGPGTMAQDPQFQAEAALLEAQLQALEITQLRVVAAHGKGPAGGADPFTSILKVRGSELYQSVCELLCRIAGPAGLIAVNGGDEEEDAPTEDTGATPPRWGSPLASTYLYSRAATIYGGSNEIQKTILAKHVLGI
ncbi:acyl-CoA dehydrogenase family protein [Hydrogenophaga sp.]|uniref:acyl-CoA dehydrogenase family protein n=1 Tax=Hydrogenophaga sp. TaxID=1904254 RepID=UPI00272732EE|nr:acyl-CoA dehydrogenase family protein [Hydrogenophaga sp.]MDO9439071.1 acyl-CoA dehydrogenase family protein [Hydrogenophaga sp.]